MSSQTVPFGPFRFSTKADLDQARLKFREQASSFGTALTGASINGQSFSFAAPDGQTYTREEYGDALAAAYVSIGITDYGFPTPPRVASRLV